MAAANPAAMQPVRQDVLDPGRRTRGLGRAWTGGLEAVTKLLNAIGSIGILGLMCMMLADLGSRFAFNRPLSGVAEIAGLSIVAIVYLQLAAAVQSGRMTRADFIADWIVRKAPRLGHLMTALFQLLGACTMAGLACVSYGPFISAWGDNEMLGTPGVFLIATWPFRGLVLLGSALAALCYLTLTIAAVTRLAAPAERTHD